MILMVNSIYIQRNNNNTRGFTSGLVVKILPANAVAMQQLSSWNTTTEPTGRN